MGKTQDIKSLASSLGLAAAHKVLVKKTTKPESSKHLSDEIRDYGFDAFEKAQAHNWTREEIAEIKEKSVKRALRILERYEDIIFDNQDVNEAVKDTLQELMLE